MYTGREILEVEEPRNEILDTSFKLFLNLVIKERFMFFKLISIMSACSYVRA